jgi:two-component sensor histidine kinase
MSVIPAANRQAAEGGSEEASGRTPDARTLASNDRRQDALLQLGILALRGVPLQALLDDTVRLTAEALEIEFCKVLQYLPAEKDFLVRAGVGWGPGVVGHARVGSDLASPAGYALHTGQPVISNDLEKEERFRTPALLVRHGIHRAMNVILQGDGAPFGVLEADSRTAADFTTRDLAFLQAVANLLGMAIDRARIEEQLRAAVDMHKTLLEEVNHRVKNSLQLVISMLQLQAGASENGEVRRQLKEASNRITAIARVHQRLYQEGRVGSVDLGGYLADVCRDLDKSLPDCTIEAATAEGIEIAIDRAIPIALLVNEIITNAAKHAYPDRSDGAVRLQLQRVDAAGLMISISDEGVGLPSASSLPAGGGGMGLRIVDAFARQLGADLQSRVREHGTEVVLRLAVDDPRRQPYSGEAEAPENPGR